MSIVRKLPENSPGIINKYLARVKEYMGPGAVTLYLILTFLAILLGSSFVGNTKVFIAGQVASEDVMAQQDMVLVDVAATKARNEQVLVMQPLVADINSEPILALRQRVLEVFEEVTGAADDTELAAISDSLALEIGDDLGARALKSLAGKEVQETAIMRILPMVEQRLLGGVTGDVRLLSQYKGGVLIRNLESGTETLREDPHSIPDIITLKAEIINRLKGEVRMPSLSRRALGVLVAGMVTPTLFPNIEATQTRNVEILDSMEPVYTKIQRGEIIVRQGEKVTREQQQQLQSLWRKGVSGFNPEMTLGVFMLSVILSSGIFFSPSGRKASSLGQRDLFFIGTLILFFVLLAKGASIVGFRMADTPTGINVNVLAYGIPVSGAAGLAALIFSTRRYFVTSLLLAFLCSIVSGGTLELFLFYFIGAMWNTWLIVRAQTRQDVVWSVLPLIAGLVAIWAGSTFISSEINPHYMAELTAVLIHGILSLLLVFALSPIVEMFFGHTTRFKLMELMNMEQPLIQELMMAAPGTYHHSIIVANMVEAGAKAIGANSLLCKVAALYHDIGKLAKPEYFIENQYGGENRHDKLTPSMSALVLISHLKKGVEWGQQHKLGQEIVDIIAQHHGTSLIRFFYQKAINLGENPREEDYRYPGPRPQSREAAIVMLADVVEASSRTLNDPTPARLRSHIDGIIKYLFSEGQLDESELTFKDLHKLSENFQRILTGLFHQRIEYPERKAAEQKNAPGANVPAPAKASSEKDAASSTGSADVAEPEKGSGDNTKSAAHSGKSTVDASAGDKSSAKENLALNAAQSLEADEVVPTQRPQ